MHKKEENFEQKKLDLEVWLQRMESRLAGMAPVGHTADVLEVQLREQKGLHAELHQFKTQIESFQQLTQRLITAHQHEDTSRFKKVPTYYVLMSSNSLLPIKLYNCSRFQDFFIQAFPIFG